jgi:hypothetical protein
MPEYVYTFGLTYDDNQDTAYYLNELKSVSVVATSFEKSTSKLYAYSVNKVKITELDIGEFVIEVRCAKSVSSMQLSVTTIEDEVKIREIVFDKMGEIPIMTGICEHITYVPNTKKMTVKFSSRLSDERDAYKLSNQMYNLNVVMTVFGQFAGRLHKTFQSTSCTIESDSVTATFDDVDLSDVAPPSEKHMFALGVINYTNADDDISVSVQDETKLFAIV